MSHPTQGQPQPPSGPPPGYGPQQYQQGPQPKKKHTLRTVILILVGIVVLGIGGCTALVASFVPDTTSTSAEPAASTTAVAPAPSSSGSSRSATAARSSDPSAASTGSAETTKATTTKAATQTKEPTKEATKEPAKQPTKGGVTSQEENAIGAAQDYLANEPFSRSGLIEQLSSSSGDGYSKKDATYAVDSLHTNYNEQAAKAAKNYLSNEHFSHTGLVQQLESSYGDGYTHSQAQYGANHAR